MLRRKIPNQNFILAEKPEVKSKKTSGGKKDGVKKAIEALGEVKLEEEGWEFVEV